MESVTCQKSKSKRNAILSLLYNQVPANDALIQSLIQKINETGDVYNIRDSLTPEEREFFIQKLNYQKAIIQGVETSLPNEYVHYRTDMNIIEKLLDQF